METETISNEEQALRREMADEVFSGIEAPEPAVDDSPADEDLPESDTGVDEDDAPDTDEGADTGQDSDDEAGTPTFEETLADINSRLSVIETLDNRLKQAERRIGSIQNEFHSAKKAAVETADAPSDKEMADAAATEEAWNSLKEDFPDWAAAIEGKIRASKSAVPDISGVTKTVEGLRGSMVTGPALEERLVSMMHPGWQQTVVTPEYKTWIAKQPKELRDKTASDRAEDAVAVLNAFKESASKPKKGIVESRNKRLAAAVNPGKGPRTKTVKSEEDMTETELRQSIAKEVWNE